MSTPIGNSRAAITTLEQYAIATAEVVRLVEHAGDLLHSFYDMGLSPGTLVSLSGTTPDGGYTVLRDGAEVLLASEQAQGVDVRPR